MENLTFDSAYHVSRIICLPFIKQPPSDLTTINTALHIAVKRCAEKGQKTCFVTFDQPLYIKARSIVSSSNKVFDNVVIRLGGFHMLMSFLGAVGNIMNGSGMHELRSLAYASASIKKMMNGHAYARAVRAHIITYTALGIIIAEDIDGINGAEYHERLSQLFNNEDAEKETFNLTACSRNNDIKLLTNKIVDKLSSLKQNGPTAELWLQYFDFITIMLQFIQAERLGDWKLHLQCVKNMLPVFHAGGHFPYGKSAQIYLQDMADLEIRMNDVEYANFAENGYFTICRSDKNWSGIWTDQTIEQTIMRDCKDVGGLTHGRGITPSSQARFILGKMAAFDVIESLEEYCQIFFEASEQHVDMRVTRQARDNQDIKNLLIGSAFIVLSHRETS